MTISVNDPLLSIGEQRIDPSNGLYYRWTGSAWSLISTDPQTVATNLVGGNNTNELGSIPYQANVNDTNLLDPNTSTTKKFLTQTGNGTNGAAPAWGVLVKSDIIADTVAPFTLETVTVTASTTGTATVVAGDVIVGYAVTAVTGSDAYVLKAVISSTTLTVTMSASTSCVVTVVVAHA